MFRLLLVPVLTTALLAAAVPASADPGPADPGGATPVAAAGGVPTVAPAVAGVPPAVPPAAALPPAVPPVADGKVASSPPATSTLDGVTLTISAKDETQQTIPPLTTAISTREYVVGGVFAGKITGTDKTPEGIFEVGYQIGCGIDMSTGGGVLLGGSVIGAANADVLIAGVGGNIIPVPILGVGAGVGGQLGVNLKPGIINTVPLARKTYKGAAPQVEIRDFRVKIDGCVGQSFIRSYATLASSTAQTEDIVSWFGVTKAV